MGGKYKKPIINEFDLAILGAGSAGSIAANDAASRGKKVAIIEQSSIGGECLNTTCIPTKALLESVRLYRQIQESSRLGVKVNSAQMDHKSIEHWVTKTINSTGVNNRTVFSEKNIKVYRGNATFVDPYTISVNYRKITAKNFLIATGSQPRIPYIQGLFDAGFLTYRDLSTNFDYPKSICFLGGGSVAYEYSQILSALGTKVHILEKYSHIMPNCDPEVSDLASSYLQDIGIKIHVGAQILEVSKNAKIKHIIFNHQGRKYKLAVDEIVVSSGKAPNTDIALENAGVRYDENGVTTNSYMQTTQKHIYAAGEVVGLVKTASASIKEAQIATHNIYSHKKVSMDYSAIPMTVYGYPEISYTGKTERELKMTGQLYQTAIAPIGILGKSITTQYSSGFVKLVASHEGVVIGASIVAPNASEIINLISYAISNEDKACDLANAVYSYPSWSEAVRIAASKIYCI